MYSKINNIHLIGIGGIGMSGIAQLLLNQGYDVTGSDMGRGENVRTLEEKGIRVFQGHRPENLGRAQLVVHSSAIRPDNPEIVAARAANIPVIPRADMLSELMRLKYGIAVAGAHGKTTTTSMIGTVLMAGELDPTIVVGGRMDNFGGTNARPGTGDFMVVEADESDGSFVQLNPSIAVATNMDREHMDFYGSMDRLKRAFLDFLNKVPFYGASIICGDDPYLKQLIPQITRRTVTYGFGEGNRYQLVDYRWESWGSVIRIRVGGEEVSLELQVPGRHNALNAVAALAVSDELSIPRERAIAGLRSFQGVQRRFQYRGEVRGVRFVDDYAHHPIEIAATLAAARERYPGSKVRVVFQPHRYSRVADLLDQFTTCFKSCDEVAITDIYAAGESPIPGVESPVLVDTLARAGQCNVHYVSSPKDAVSRLLEESSPGDVIFTLGAGDLPNVYRELF